MVRAAAFRNVDGGRALHNAAVMIVAAGLLEQVRAEAAASPDREICGLLFGSPVAIERAVPAANVATAPATAFEVDPAALVAAYRAERAGGPGILGCYHSHPSGDATPSTRDAAAAEAGRYWLIVAGADARLWRARQGGFDEVPFDPRP